eukprot:230955-Chlamydomonas_euryale.AAC.11
MALQALSGSGQEGKPLVCTPEGGLTTDAHPVRSCCSLLAGGRVVKAMHVLAERLYGREESAEVAGKGGMPWEPARLVIGGAAGTTSADEQKCSHFWRCQPLSNLVEMENGRAVHASRIGVVVGALTKTVGRNSCTTPRYSEQVWLWLCTMKLHRPFQHGELQGTLPVNMACYTKCVHNLDTVVRPPSRNAPAPPPPDV